MPLTSTATAKARAVPRKDNRDLFATEQTAAAANPADSAPAAPPTSVIICTLVAPSLTVAVALTFATAAATTAPVPIPITIIFFPAAICFISSTPATSPAASATTSAATTALAASFLVLAPGPATAAAAAAATASTAPSVPTARPTSNPNFAPKHEVSVVCGCEAVIHGAPAVITAVTAPPTRLNPVTAVAAAPTAAALAKVVTVPRVPIARPTFLVLLLCQFLPLLMFLLF